MGTAIGLGLASGALLMSLVFAAPTAEVQAEVSYLLQHIEESGCEFNRNGTWYGGKRARAHLATKYQYLLGHDLISTADEFIERAASKSSITGTPYQIRCNGGAPVPSSQWLHDALAAYQETKAASPLP